MKREELSELNRLLRKYSCVTGRDVNSALDQIVYDLKYFSFQGNVFLKKE